MAAKFYRFIPAESVKTHFSRRMLTDDVAQCGKYPVAIGGPPYLVHKCYAEVHPPDCNLPPLQKKYYSFSIQNDLWRKE